MANFVNNSVIYFLYYKDTFNISDDRQAIIEALKQDLNEEYRAVDTEEPTAIKLRSKDDIIYTWIDEESIMLITWFSANEQENKQRLTKAKAALESFTRCKLTPKEYKKIVIKASGYYFPGGASAEEESRPAVTKLMAKIINPQRSDDILDYTVDLTRKTKTGRNVTSYHAVRNEDTGVHALAIEVSNQIEPNEPFGPDKAGTYASDTNILEVLEDERQKVENFK